MSRCRFVVPELVRIEISDGDWIEVKKDLTHGEVENVREHGLTTEAFVIECLAAWSLVGPTGATAAIDTYEKRRDALRSIDQASYLEIETAVLSHLASRREQVEAQKKTTSAAAPSATSGPSLG